VTDAVGRIVEEWREQRPDLDPSPMLVVGRIHRVGQLLDEALRPTFARAGLGRGDFDVLAALRRAGPPYRRTAGELRDALMVTSGAITKQVDRLAAQGLVARDVGEHDARVRHISLTDRGVALVDELIAVHLDTERRLLSGLPADQAAQLAAVLGTFAERLEDGTAGG
jgi:DNA-binding MarR family transcriptional regulator